MVVWSIPLKTRSKKNDEFNDSIPVNSTLYALIVFFVLILSIFCILLTDPSTIMGQSTIIAFVAIGSFHAPIILTVAIKNQNKKLEKKTKDMKQTRFFNDALKLLPLLIWRNTREGGNTSPPARYSARIPARPLPAHSILCDLLVAVPKYRRINPFHQNEYVTHQIVCKHMS
jgi:hypothetical protein